MTKKRARKAKGARKAAPSRRRETKKKAKIRMPTKTNRAVTEKRDRDEGPAEWFFSQIEETYTRLAPVGYVPPPPPSRAARAPGAAAPASVPFESTLQPGRGEAVLASAVQTSIWAERLAEYKRRKAAAAAPAGAAPPVPARAAPPAPAIPGGRNWLPLGPTVVLGGQTASNEPVGGRVVGLAVATGGRLLYAASACGGVFRSDDGAATWQSLMDGFDVDPTNFASASLACGAIAMDPADTQRVYVGTGEGETHQLFRSRVVNALPAYRGIGPIRTDDGGQHWVTEATAVGSPPLVGEAFFTLAIDPRDRENVVAATTVGLYQRTLSAGTPTWTQTRAGVHSSVVVAGAGATVRFFAAEWGVGVSQSTDGTTWTAVGIGFPSTNVSRITLAVQSGNPNIVYAMIARQDNGSLHGVYRLDVTDGAWKAVTSPPNVLPLIQGRSQGAFDLAMTVDAADVNRLYLGGNFAGNGASVWRANVTASGTGWRFTGSRSIGTHAHADVHALLHSPNDPNELWCGSDGGVFLNRNPTGTGEFAGVNSGLSCLCTNFIAQHPTDPNIIFSGLQDNGTARTAGGSLWQHVNYGDGGYCLVNWNDPDKVLSFVNGRVYKSDNGGATHEDWVEAWNLTWATMTQPIVGPPMNAAVAAEADIIAVGAAQSVHVSRDFAVSWKTADVITLPGVTASESIFALAFASATRLFIGTTRGKVFRADWSGTAWTIARLDTAPAGALGLVGLITDIGVDWADATLGSMYITFGGLGDTRRVWHFDGNRWEVRSGSPGQDLLDVEHNALVVDRAAPANLYVGADIGVWHSPDSGNTWAPLQNGLPDAPVFDLQIHPTQRLIRAATHGRGVYELALT